MLGAADDLFRILMGDKVERKPGVHREART